MKSLSPLIFIAAIANLLSIFLYNYAASEPGGSGLAMEFAVLWMPAVWLCSIVATIAVSVINRKTIFKDLILKWTLFTIFFTTPIPLCIIYYLTRPNAYREGSSVNYQKGKVYIGETWVNRFTQKKVLEKSFIADSAEESIYGEQAYKKEGAWVYFNDTGDTLKVESYRNDTLFSTKQYTTK